MKFASLAAIGLVAAKDSKSFDPTATIEWGVDGVSGYHEGFSKAFYKTSTHDKDQCLNKETVENMAKFGALMADPLNFFKNITNVAEDVNLLANGAEIIENIATCRFEGPAFDMLHTCSTDKEACTINKFIENVTKNMFVLVGKLTSMAETFKGFPATENDDFKEQMMEVGDDFGTFFRIFFNYHSQ